MKVVEQFKRRILDLAIRGKLVPQDPNDEPASELLARIKAEKESLIKAGKIKKSKGSTASSDGAAYEKFGSGNLSRAEAQRRGEGESQSSAVEDAPFGLPQGWTWCRLGTVCEIRGGKRIPAGRKLTEADTGHKYIRVSDMRDGCVSTKQLLFVPADIYPSISRYIIKKEDVFITVAGTLGRVGKIPPELDGANLTENADRLILNGAIIQDWLIYVLNSQHLKDQITSAYTQVGQPKLAITRLAQFTMPLPPLAEQRRIVARIEVLFKVADSFGEAANRLEVTAKRLDKKILDLAIRGKLVPQNPNDEPASNLMKRIAATSHKPPYRMILLHQFFGFFLLAPSIVMC